MRIDHHWHIFCRVIDNYGDIGTTWRLAQQLTHEYQQHITLFVDDLAPLAQLLPEANPKAQQQTLNNINVQHWTTAFPDIEAAPFVIEAFACTLPDNYRLAMIKKGSICINLEYFSCEDWVESCHGLPSYQSDGLKKWFFFPGITPQTGGLLRERTLLIDRDHFCQNQQQHNEWCHRWQVPIPQLNSIKLSLFGYENNALPNLLHQLSQQENIIEAYLPEGKLRASAHVMFPNTSLTTGNTLMLGSLRLHLIPFLPQSQFDRLLWMCDLNFVRGEESLARAIWAAKPFVWHIYPTDDGAHWNKLNAFMTAYQLNTQLRKLTTEWNQQTLGSDILTSTLYHLAELTQCSHQITQQLSQQKDLCHQLFDFVRDK